MTKLLRMNDRKHENKLNSGSKVCDTYVEDQIHHQSTTKNQSTVPVHLEKLFKDIPFVYGKRKYEECDNTDNEEENMDNKGSADHKIPETVLQLEAELKRKFKKREKKGNKK